MPRTLRLVPFLTVLALGRAHAAPRPETGFGLPRDVSLDGWRIDWLIDVTLIAVTVLFVIMVVWMLIACLRHGRRHAAHYDPGDSRRAIGAKALVAGAIFLGVDGNLFVNSTRDLKEVFWNFERVEADPRAVRVEVNAHQWAWDFRYPGPDGRFNTADDIVTLNELRVPIDTPVLLQLGATDVIHSFYVPNLRVKTDCVPGSLSRVWFQAKETGEFEIGCAQHCGTHHYKMRGLLRVVAQSEWEAWHREASAIASRAFDPSDERAQWGWPWRKP
ncbi:MAG: cytochrome C oxidase subunit II [Myxococcota bacterium]